MGIAASMGSFHMAEKKVKEQYCHARHMIHSQPMVVQVVWLVMLRYNTKNYWKETLTDVYVKHTGVERDKIAKDMDRDFFP